MGYRKVCGLSCTPFSRERPWRKTAAAALVSYGNSCAAIKTAVCRCALSVKKWSRNARRRFWTTDKNRNSLIHNQSEAEDIFNRLQQKTALPKQSRRDASEDKISAWRTGVHRWQGCALHAMLEQRFISASGSPLAGQPPEMRSRAPLFSGKVSSKKTALPKQSRRCI